MDWSDVSQILGKIAPTVVSAFGGPLAGVAVAAVGEIIGMSEPTQAKIKAALENGQLTGAQIQALRELDAKYQAEELERGFRYADLAFRDRDSARRANVDGGTQGRLFWLSLLLLSVSLGCEIAVLFTGYPEAVPEIIVGRVLGLMDAVAMMVLAYWYGTTNGSAQKSTMLANSTPAR